MRFLDYKKVKDEERKKAKELFGTEEEPTQLAAKVCVFCFRWVWEGEGKG